MTKIVMITGVEFSVKEDVVDLGKDWKIALRENEKGVLIVATLNYAKNKIIAIDPHKIIAIYG